MYKAVYWMIEVLVLHYFIEDASSGSKSPFLVMYKSL